ncbi:hypothetical protein [Streptomyces echinatus]|uniref:hypothetical protein n=1 Tax=Streptomyces echinatus TaxID=67293 RepID=UPI0037941AD3
MSESNDTLTALLIFAGFLHILTLLGMILHTALAEDQPDNNRAQQKPLTALLLGHAPVQRTGRSTFISRLLAVAGLLLTATFVLSLATAAPPPPPGPSSWPGSPRRNWPVRTPGTSPLA